MATTTLRKLHDTVGQMQKNLECSICLDLLRNPVSTKCDHQFCSMCITSMFSRRRKTTAPCPLCKESITKRSLTKNERMNEIVSAVRGVAFALEQDTGIRCTPPKGPPCLSQSNSSATDDLVEKKQTKTTTQQKKKNKPVRQRRQNIRQTKQPAVQQVHVYIDSDYSDGEGRETQQLATTNTNISSSFPVPSNKKGKKGKQAPARKSRRKPLKQDNAPANLSKRDVSSNNAHNSLLNALGKGSPGTMRSLENTEEGDMPEAMQTSTTSDSEETSAPNREGILLEALHESSLGFQKDNSESQIVDSVYVRVEDTDAESQMASRTDIPEEDASVPDNTELVADIFGLSPSSQNEDQPQSHNVVHTLEENVTQEQDTGVELCFSPYSQDQTPRHLQNGINQVENDKVPISLADANSSRISVGVSPTFQDQLQDEVIDLENEKEELSVASKSSKTQKAEQTRVKNKKTELKTVNNASISTKSKENDQIPPPEEDPYEFIASQRTPKKVKGKAGRRKKKAAGQATGVSYTSGKLKKFGNKAVCGSKMVGKQKAGGAASKKKTGASKAKPSGEETADIVVIDDEDLEDDQHRKTATSMDTRNERVEGLFNSEATNDTCNPEEDIGGLPLFDYEDSSDEEPSLPCSDGSFKPGGRVLRRQSIESQDRCKRVTRRQKQNKTRSLGDEGNEADDSSTSTGDVANGPSLRKRKAVKKTSERKSRRKNKQADSSKEQLDEDIDPELEVSYIQDHLQECDDIVLHVDGDSQKVCDDKGKKQPRNEKVTTVPITEEQHEESAFVDDSKASDSAAKHSARKDKSTIVSSNINESEPILIEDDEQSATKHDNRIAANNKLANEISDPFKKPSKGMVKKSMQHQNKPKGDWITISKTTSLRKKTSEKVQDNIQQDDDQVQPLQDPDGDELTLVDSQRVRKKRSPAGSRVFFNSYKRGSLRLEKNSAQESGGDDEEEDEVPLEDVFADENEDTCRDDDISSDEEAVDNEDDINQDESDNDDAVTMVDVFGDAHNDEENDNTDDVVDMEVSDVHQDTTTDDDANEPKQDEVFEVEQQESSTTTGSKRKKISADRTIGDSPVPGNDDDIVPENNIKKASRMGKRNMNDKLVPDHPAELQKSVKASVHAFDNSSRSSRSRVRNVSTEKQESNNAPERRSKRSAKKSKADDVEIEEEGSEKDAGRGKKSTRSHSGDASKSKDSGDASKSKVAQVVDLSGSMDPGDVKDDSVPVKRSSRNRSRKESKREVESAEDEVRDKDIVKPTKKSTRRRMRDNSKTEIVLSDFEDPSETSEKSSAKISAKKDVVSTKRQDEPKENKDGLVVETNQDDDLLAKQTTSPQKSSPKAKNTNNRGNQNTKIQIEDKHTHHDEVETSATKSDWEIALELAREFDTEPRQFRLRNGQRFSDEISGNRFTRGTGRNKPKLDMSTVSGTNRAKSWPFNEGSRSQDRDVEEIEAYSTENSESMKSVESKRSTPKSSSKKRNRKRSNTLPHQEPSIECAAAADVSAKSTTQNKMSGKVTKGAQKVDLKESSHSMKQVIPETPMIPLMNTPLDSFEQRSDQNVDSSGQRKSVDGRASSLQPPAMQVETCLISTAEDEEPVTRLSKNIANQKAAKSPKVIPQTPLLNSVDVINSQDVVDQDDEMVVKGQKNTRQRKQLSKMQSKITDDSSDADDIMANTRRDGDLPRKPGRTLKRSQSNQMKSRGRVGSVSSDRKPLRSSRRNANKTSQSSCGEDVDPESSASRERKPLKSSGRNANKISKSSRGENRDSIGSDIRERQPVRSSARNSQRTQSSDSDALIVDNQRNEQEMSKSRSTDMDQRSQQAPVSKVQGRSKSPQQLDNSDVSKRPSRTRTLRSRRGTMASQPSGAESSDLDSSRSRERVLKSKRLSLNKNQDSHTSRTVGLSGQTKDASESNDIEVLSTPQIDAPVLTPKSNKKQDVSNSSKTKSPHSKEQQSHQDSTTKGSSGSPQSLASPWKSNRTPSNSELTRKSPRRNCSKKNALDQSKVKQSANSGALFSEDDNVFEEGGDKLMSTKDAGKGSDTTESIDLGLSNEEFEQENPDVQLWSKPSSSKKTETQPSAGKGIDDRLITTRRRKNKLSRKRMKNSEADSTKTLSFSTSGTETDTLNDGDAMSSDTVVELPVCQPNLVADSEVLPEEPRLEKTGMQIVEEEKSGGGQRLVNSAESNPDESSLTPQGSESDIFRCSESPNTMTGVNSERLGSSENQKKAARMVEEKENTVKKTFIDVSMEASLVSPHLESLEVGTLGSSLESEPLLVPASKHYRDTFMPSGNILEDKSVKELICGVEGTQEEEQQGIKRRSKRKSFALGNSPDSEQQNKKRRSGEAEESRSNDASQSERSPAVRRSGRSSQQRISQNGLMDLPNKDIIPNKEITSNTDAISSVRSTKHSQHQLIEVVPPSNLVDSEVERTRYPPDSDSLQTKRRSRISGSRHGSFADSPRAMSTALQSADIEVAIVVSNEKGRRMKGKRAEQEAILTPSPGKMSGQSLSGSKSSAITSPRRSSRTRHSPTPSSSAQSDGIASQMRSSRSLSGEDKVDEIANSGSLFGTQIASLKTVGSQSQKQSQVSSQTSCRIPATCPDYGEGSEVDDQEEIIDGSQCMFGSDPNSSSEHDVEMMSEGSEDEYDDQLEDQDYVVEDKEEHHGEVGNDVETKERHTKSVRQNSGAPHDTPGLYSEGTGAKQIPNLEQERSPREVSTIPDSVAVLTTIPDSVASLNETSVHATNQNQDGRYNNSSDKNRKCSGSVRSGSASTYVPASEDASVSPDKLSEPIPLGRRRKESSMNSGSLTRRRNRTSQKTDVRQQSTEEHSDEVVTSGKLSDKRSGSRQRVLRNSEDKGPVKVTSGKPNKQSGGKQKASGDSRNENSAKESSSNEKKKPYKLSDINLCDSDVDGDHDLLFEEDDDDVLTLTPVVAATNGEISDNLSLKEKQFTDDNDALPEASRKGRPMEDDRVAEDIADDVMSEEDVMKEEPREAEEQEAQEESDGEAMESDPDDHVAKTMGTNNIGKDSHKEIAETEEEDVEAIIRSQEDGDVKGFETLVEDTEEDDDELIPPTPPCAALPLSSFSKPRVGSTSFLTSKRSPLSISGSSNSFSNQSGKSFVFKHPSATHSQRTVKGKLSGGSIDAALSSIKESKAKKILDKDDKSSGQSKNEAVLDDNQSLEGSQSLSLLDITAGGSAHGDLNAVQKNSQVVNIRKTSQTSRSSRKGKSSDEVSSDQTEEQSYVERRRNMRKKKRRRHSGMRGDQEEEQNDVTARSALQRENQASSDVNGAESEADGSNSDRRRRNVNPGSKSSTSDEKDYDTEASICSEDSSSTNHHLNMTSASSVMSSQSEVLSTQQQAKVQETLMKMQQEIAQMEATLATAGNQEVDDSDMEESDTELESKMLHTDYDGVQHDDVFRDADDEIAPNDADEGGELQDTDQDETLDPRHQDDDNLDVQDNTRQQTLSKSRENTHKQGDHDGSRRSQRLVISDEDESDNDENDKGKSTRGDKGTRHIDTLGNQDNSEDDKDDEPLPSCPRSPSPPPPLTQGKMQKYSSKSPLQETLQSVTKLAEQFKSGNSSGKARSKKRPVARHQRADSEEDRDEASSAKSKRPSVTETLQYKPMSSDSDSLDDDDVTRRGSQRKRNYKRRLRSDSDSSEEETAPRNVKKFARLKNLTPRSRGGSTPIAKGKAIKRDLVKLRQRTESNSQDPVRTQRTADNNQYESARNSQVSKRNANQSQLLPSKTSPRAIENSLPKSSRKSGTPNSTERHSAGSVDAVKRTKSPLAAGSAGVANQGSPLMESSCRRTLLQEDSAPVVAKNLRKNDGRFSFVATGLSRQELREVERLTKLTGCKFASMFNANTTHVIINTDEDLVCERTLKYFQGVAARVWIVSYSWVDACLKTNELLHEEGFEIQGDVVNGRSHGGPERARMWKDKPLMRNYEICAVGPYTGLNKDQLVSLLELCGSTTVQHPTLFPFDAGHHFYIVVQQNCDHTQQDYDALYKKYRVPVVSREWVLDSVATYTVQPINEYLLSGDQQPIIDLDSEF